MLKVGRIGVWIVVAGVALVTQACWEEEQGLALLGDGGCRLADGSEGDPTTIGAASTEECQAQCFTGGTPCVAVEYNANNSRCEIHREPITKFEKLFEGVACYVNEHTDEETAQAGAGSSSGTRLAAAPRDLSARQAGPARHP